MENTKDLDKAVDNLKQLVILYGEITEALIGDLEKSNHLLEEANRNIEKLQKQNETLVHDLAKLKQKKYPSIDTITELMSEFQDVLLKAKKHTSSQDLDNNVNGQEEKSEEENPVFDLRKDKASDEDGFNCTTV